MTVYSISLQLQYIDGMHVNTIDFAKLFVLRPWLEKFRENKKWNWCFGWTSKNCSLMKIFVELLRQNEINVRKYSKKTMAITNHSLICYITCNLMCTVLWLEGQSLYLYLLCRCLYHQPSLTSHILIAKSYSVCNENR